MGGFNFLSLSAATGTGAGTSFDAGQVGDTRSGITWSVVVTGAPSACVVNLEGSINSGANWFTLDTCNATTSEMRHVVNKDVQLIRANLATLTAGTAPTVTARIYKGE
jgi:hypothetical protein